MLGGLESFPELDDVLELRFAESGDVDQVSRRLEEPGTGCGLEFRNRGFANSWKF